MGKITIKHFLPKNVKPIQHTFQDKKVELHPVYINIITRKQNFKFKGLFNSFLLKPYTEIDRSPVFNNYVTKKHFKDSNDSQRNTLNDLFKREIFCVENTIRILDSIPDNAFSLKNYEKLIELALEDFYKMATSPFYENFNSKDLKSALAEVGQDQLYQIIDKSIPYDQLHYELFVLLGKLKSDKKEHLEFDRITKFPLELSKNIRRTISDSVHFPFNPSIKVISASFIEYLGKNYDEIKMGKGKFKEFGKEEVEFLGQILEKRIEEIRMVGSG